MSRYLKLGLLLAAVVLVITIAYAESFYTVIVRTDIRVGPYIADTASFSLSATGAASFTKAVYTGGTSTDMYFLTWRFDSAAQRFPKDYQPVTGTLDSTSYLAYYAKADSVIAIRSDTTFWKTRKFTWMRAKQAP